MRELRVTDEIVPLTEFRARLTEKIDNLSRGSGMLVLTRNGQAAAVVLSPAEYDRLRYESFVRGKIIRGLSDIADGETTSHEEVMRQAREVVRERDIETD